MDDLIIEMDHIPVTEMDYQKQDDYIRNAKKLMLGVKRGTELLQLEIIPTQMLREEWWACSSMVIARSRRACTRTIYLVLRFLIYLIRPYQGSGWILYDKIDND